MPWGARQPPWPPPPPQIGSEGAGPPLPCPYIYVGGGRAAAPKFWRSPPPLPCPPPLPRCLAKPCRIATLLHHHHAVVLLLDGVFPNLSLSPCWIKAWETSSGCTCVERGGVIVRRLDRNQPRSESLRVRLLHPHSCNAFRIAIFKGMKMHSPLSPSGRHPDGIWGLPPPLGREP